MSEEVESIESAPKRNGTLDPVAVSLALCAASQAEADAFLKKQTHLADLQAHHLGVHPVLESSRRRVDETSASLFWSD